MKCFICLEEITPEEELASFGEPSEKCWKCREDPKRVIEYIRRRGGFKEVFGQEDKS